TMKIVVFSQAEFVGLETHHFIAMDAVVLLLLCFTPVVWCYPSGLFTDSCDTMMPQHGANTQNGSAPFNVSLNIIQTYTVSHTSASTKTSIQATWTAEASASGTPIQFFVHGECPLYSHEYGYINMTVKLKPFFLQMSISNAQCGDTKTCFSQPFNCDPSASSDCYFMSTMTLSTSNGAVHYEMKGPSNGYIAFGFSDDQIMGNDDIYICGMDSRGLPTLQHAYARGKTFLETISLGDVSNLTATMQNNVISCSFITTNAISTQRSISSNQNYYILFAYGPSSNGNVDIGSTFTSTGKINFSNVQLLATKSETPAIVKAHGALMLISWMTTGSLGMIVARYLKGMARGQKMFDKDLWFVVHVPVMCVTVAATIIAFIIIFVYGQGWAGVSCLIMILSFIQPIIAFLRCGPQHPTRYVFNWTHSLNALVIKILAVAAIFTGLELIDGSDSQWMVKTMSGFTAWECLFYTNTDNLLVGVYFLGNIAFLVALLVGIGTATVVP
uniref:DOMON domain-containing protein n=1 Tax=Anabas testudineus TaxID=64144 RepID=A0A3Q1IT59_ANATE